jgi:hypothetical protein
VKSRTRFFFSSLAVLFAMVSLIGNLQADENKVFTWKKPSAGTHAFLGDDGGGVNTKTVCDTADRYRDWLKMESAPGCPTFEHDLPILIEFVLLDAVKDTVGSTWLPLVKFHIPSRNFTGYSQLLGVHPIVPVGTKIHFTREGNARLQLYKTANVSQNESFDLGDKVSATVLSSDPTQDDKWDLYVNIDDGPYAGRKGWMLGQGATTDDGKPMDQFDQAVIENKPRR